MLFRLALATLAIALASPASAETWRDPASGIEFRLIAKACGQMGRSKPLDSPGGQDLRDNADLRHIDLGGRDEMPRHEVCLDAFWIGVKEVSADEWARVMGLPPPIGKGDEPAAGISWLAAEAFFLRMTRQAADGSRFRFPTEAEWEHACKAGQEEEVWSYGQGRERAWYFHLQRLQTSAAPTGTLLPNAWGLHDMIGNVWEWVADDYAPEAYRHHALFNPRVSDARAPGKVIRGGSFRSDAVHARCGKRSWHGMRDALPQMGLRAVRLGPDVPPARPGAP